MKRFVLYRCVSASIVGRRMLLTSVWTQSVSHCCQVFGFYENPRAMVIVGYRFVTANGFIQHVHGGVLFQMPGVVLRHFCGIGPAKIPDQFDLFQDLGFGYAFQGFQQVLPEFLYR